MAITINLTGQVDGTFTVEDDGTPGNGTSIVRRPNATILTTFGHPADAVTIISRTGQNVNVNFTDSLTTANFTIGSLTVPAERPDAIQMGAVLTSGIVTLTANNTINEFGNDGATDIVAGTLLLDAGTGIGVSNAIETQVSVLEAESVTGGINISNINNVTIGNSTGELRGLFTGTSGNITLLNQGSITLNDTNGTEIVHSAGSLNLTAIGAAADIAAIADRDALFARGDILLSAGRDILFGRTGVDFDNDVRAGGSIFVTAGRDFIIDGFSDMAADDQGLASNGRISISVGRDILIDDANGVDASVGISASTSTGSIFLQTGIGGTLLLHANSSAAIQGRVGGVTIEADRVLIENDSGINVTGNGAVTLTTRSAGREIILGSATDGVTAMELSDAELDRIVATTLNIGSVNGGPIRVAGAIDPLGAPHLVLRSGFDILLLEDVTATTSLTLLAGDNVVIDEVSLTAPTLSIFVDQKGGDGGVGGTIDLSAVTITATSVTLAGDVDNDTIIGSSVGDHIYSFGGNDLLYGLGGNDVLFGGSSASTMYGGTGNDTYYVSDSSDAVIEASSEGNDRIAATVSYVLAPASEVEVIEALNIGDTASLNFTGNVFINTLIGNAGNNVLTGGGGNDVMYGHGGNDTFIGGASASVMYGGAGNDTFYVSDSSDAVVEFVGEGFDRIAASVSYVLVAGSAIEQLEAITQSATDAINLTGNALNNVLVGNNGVNTLSTGGGNDTLIGLGGNDVFIGGSSASAMYGGTGNDTYYILDSADAVIDLSGEGSDRIAAAVSYTLAADAEVELLEAVSLGDTSALNFTGNAFINTLVGNNGANRLDGRGGNDILTGAGGADVFAFTTALGGFNIDRIADFVSGSDKIALDDAIFTAIGGPGALSPGAFFAGAAAHEADDRIIYDATTGRLYYDADGDLAGAAVLFATLDGNPSVAAGDFIVI